MVTKKKKITTKTRLVKVYDVATIYFGEGEFWTFKLSEWDLYRDYDWIDIVKKDGTGMEIYATVNVSRISFGMDKVKDVEPIKTDVLSIMKVDTSPLKPVA